MFSTALIAKAAAQSQPGPCHITQLTRDGLKTLLMMPECHRQFDAIVTNFPGEIPADRECVCCPLINPEAAIAALNRGQAEVEASIVRVHPNPKVPR